MKKINGRVLSWRPDLPDHRDLIFSAPSPKVAALVDIESGLPGVMNQLQTSSCTWNAITCNLGYLQLKQLKIEGKQAQEYDVTQYVPPSRLFGYYNARALIGSEKYDGGAYIRDGIKTANKTGVCRESLWPFLSAQVLTKPSAAAYAEASQYKISQYLRITTLNDMLACLSAGFPFVFGFSVYSSFYNIGKDGLLPMPKAGETLYGGHAVTACGYDSIKKIFKIRNSWGATWAAKGNFYMPFDFITKYGSDFWTIRS